MLDLVKNLFYRYYIPHKKLSQEEEFFSLIESAQKIDHQIYTEKNLIPHIKMEMNANIPSILQLLTLPCTIMHNTAKLIKTHLKAASVSLEETHYKTAAQLLNWLQAALTPVFYLATAGLLVVHISAVLITINLLALLTSCIEIPLNIYSAYKAHQFLNDFDISLLTRFSQVNASLSIKELHKNLPVLITAMNKNADAKKTPHVVEKLLELHTNTSQPDAKFEDIQSALNTLYATFKRQFLIDKLGHLEQKYLKLTKQEEGVITEKCKNYYQTCDYPTALHKSFTLIQATFKEKKILLGRQVQPWFALQLINTHQETANNLKSSDIEHQEEGIHQAFALLERANYNSHLKQQVALTNIGLFLLVIAQSTLSLCAITQPFVLPLFLIGSTLIYYFNSFRINAVLNSKTYDIHWKNCCPDWLIYCGEKIHHFFYKAYSYSAHHISAINLTSYIKKPITPTPLG